MGEPSLSLRSRWSVARFALAGLVVAMLLLSAAPAGAVSQQRVRKVPAHFVYVFDNSVGCTWAIGIEFPNVAGAESYRVRYWDGNYKQVITETVTLAQLGTDPAAGSGANYLGVTGGSYPPPCQGAGDPTESGRFSRGATVYAILASPSKLSGMVISQQCSKSGCVRKPRAGVRVVAKATSAGKGGSARTDKKGRYSMPLDDGVYDVSLSGVKGMPAKQRVVLKQDVKGVDFRTCAGAGGAGARSAAFAGCLFIVKVSVVDLVGAPLSDLTLVAKPEEAGPDFNAVATTDSAGQATFDLYEDTWTIGVASSADGVSALEEINPPATYASPQYRSDAGIFGPGFGATVTRCLGGSTGRGHCVVDLAVGKRTRSRVDIKASVAPVDVSLAAGLGLGSVRLDPSPHVSRDYDIQWFGANFGDRAPRNRLHFEVPLLPARKPAPRTWEVSAANHAGHPAPVSKCSPGQVISDSSQAPACDLMLGGGVIQGAASFSRPPG